MSASRPDRHTTPIRTFGVQDPVEDGQDSAHDLHPTLLRRVLSRLSFSSKHRPSISSHRNEDTTRDGLETTQSVVERAPIPSVRQSSAEVYTTPLPIVSMIVLSIATVAEKHGRRSVLIISLLGSAITCLIFGTATTLKQAICIRLLQGIFAGAVGVARGCVAFITDPSNEGRAYAILGSGSILSCFLGRDGGPREGAIRLGPEKIDAHPPIPEEESLPPSPVHEQPSFVGTLKKKVSQKLSGYFAQGGQDAHRKSLSSPIPPSPVPLSTSGTRLERTRTFSRTSRVNGSAYGYGSYRNSLGSNAPFGVRKSSMASTLRRRRGSNMDSIRDATETPDLNFAQRLLMANENAVTNIADLWVAAAMNVDNEDPFMSDSEGEEDSEQVLEEDNEADDTAGGELGARSTTPTPNATSPHRGSHRPSNATSVRPRDSFSAPRRVSRPSISFSPYGTLTSRRFSTATPSIFAHPGVKTPSAVLEAQQLLARSDAEVPAPGDLLDSISESRRTAAEDGDVESLVEKQPSLTSQLPIMIIIQYGMLALHTTTHDQVFMSYLVSAYGSGGLNLNAGNFAQLIALMCLAQIAYQFYLYPNIGPPRGRFSHLAMYRIGSLLFIPAYLSVILYRAFASAEDDGNFLVMTVLEYPKCALAADIEIQ
ncbi:hypothetical protein C0995_001638 [Termitomyces sp. Mi166|nr:hypothetical protein C0995_001638 [Termitomyces sp. Mi166\